MIHPSIDVLMEKINNRFSLVTSVAKRARQINEGTKILIEKKTNNAVSIALEEIANDKVKIETE